MNVPGMGEWYSTDFASIGSPAPSTTPWRAAEALSAWGLLMMPMMEHKPCGYSVEPVHPGKQVGQTGPEREWGGQTTCIKRVLWTQCGAMPPTKKFTTSPNTKAHVCTNKNKYRQ